MKPNLKKASVLAYLVCFIVLILLSSCKKNGTPDPQPEDKNGKITSAEFKDDLLFANKANYQIETSQPATFSSNDPSITITSAGNIEHLTSGEIVSINVKWTNSGSTTNIYAVGATDNQHVNPFEKFHAAASDNPYGQYLQGWQTLRKLPITGETYYIVLRHADADNGVDYNLSHPGETAPANWWKSSDNSLARQLNDPGKARATELGKIFKDLNYPVARVFTSEFYRAYQTAELMNLGLPIVKDGRINHPDYLKTGESLFNGLQNIINENPADQKMTFISTHHPINEFNKDEVVLPTFPQVSAFNWTGAYFVKVSADKTLTYQGAASYNMFKYWRDLKLKKI